MKHEINRAYPPPNHHHEERIKRIKQDGKKIKTLIRESFSHFSFQAQRKLYTCPHYN